MSTFNPLDFFALDAEVNNTLWYMRECERNAMGESPLDSDEDEGHTASPSNAGPRDPSSVRMAIEWLRQRIIGH